MIVNRNFLGGNWSRLSGNTGTSCKFWALACSRSHPLWRNLPHFNMTVPITNLVGIQKAVVPKMFEIIKQKRRSYSFNFFSFFSLLPIKSESFKWAKDVKIHKQIRHNYYGNNVTTSYWFEIWVLLIFDKVGEFIDDIIRISHRVLPFDIWSWFISNVRLFHIFHSILSRAKRTKRLHVYMGSSYPDLLDRCLDHNSWTPDPIFYWHTNLEIPN
jgi:hypothetical protein